MEFDFFIGIDVSKGELDFSVQQDNRFLFHREIGNNPEAINALLKELSKLPGFTFSKTVFCMEHTGIYCAHLLNCLHKKGTHICLEAATQIQSSIGRVRGKGDKIDSIRIAGYAYEKRASLRLWEPKRQVVERLSSLAATRQRLINVKKQLKVPITEQKAFADKETAKQCLKICGHSLKALDEDLARADKAIDQLIKADAELHSLFTLVTSVSGI